MDYEASGRESFLMKKEVLVVREANFSEISDRIREKLKERKAEPQEIDRASLLFEEIFFRAAGMGVPEMRVTIRKRLGDLSLRLAFGGEERNPLAEVETLDDDDIEAFRSLILQANTPTEY